MNYFLFKRNGKPITAQSIVNFDKNIYRNGKDYCWIYRGLLHEQGYGAYSWRYKGVPYKSDAHRFAWMIYKGEIPKGKLVCHSCDRKTCVKPEHLWLGTYKDNTQDMIKKGRMVIPDRSGDKNSRALLTWKQVREIRKRFKKRIVTGEMLGKEYGVKKHVIWLIIQGVTWKEKEKSNDLKNKKLVIR